MDDGAPIHGHTGLEIAWTALPVALVVGQSHLLDHRPRPDRDDVPADHRTIEVTARAVRLDASPTRTSRSRAASRSTGDLVARSASRTRSTITATDVIHSFWVPEFRMKQDAVPGITTQTYVTPTKVGTYPVICTELCGLGHSTMRARAIVLSHADYEKWVAKSRRRRGRGGGSGRGAGSVFTAAVRRLPHARGRRDDRARSAPTSISVLPGKDADFIQHVDRRSERRDRCGVRGRT